MQRFGGTFSALLWAATIAVPSIPGLAQTTNQVLTLDGNGDYVNVPSAPELQTPTGLTVETWIWPQNANECQYLVKGDNGSSNSQRSYQLSWGYVAGGKPNIVCEVFLGTGTYAELMIPIAATNWTHIAVTYESTLGVLQLYTNGILAVATNRNSNGTQLLAGLTVRQTSFPLNIGGQPPISGVQYSGGLAAGYMDEVRIWNRARTPVDILRDYSCKLAAATPGLVGYWTFDDGTANDETAGGHNGSFRGNAMVVPIFGVDVVHGGNFGGAPPSRTAIASGIITNGFMVGATVTDGGVGYTNIPNVRIIGGGGSGAQAVAVVNNGVVVAVTLMESGHGYTSTPTIVVDPPFIRSPTLNIAAMSRLSFSNITTGLLYRLQRRLGSDWVDQAGGFTAGSQTYTQMVAGAVVSEAYRLAPNPLPTQAVATVEVMNGFVIGARVTSGGSGYITNPVVRINGGGGSGATAVSVISGGMVTGITITSAGIGYTNQPWLQIASPPEATTFSPEVGLVMRLDSATLAPYDNYQVQSKQRLGESWMDPSDGLFCPTATTNSIYLSVTNDIGIFRLRHIP